MGTDAAIFRTMGKQTAMRTDQYNSRWLNGEFRVSQAWVPWRCHGFSPGDEMHHVILRLSPGTETVASTGRWMGGGVGWINGWTDG